MKTFSEFVTEAKIFQGKGKLGKKTISLPISAKDIEEAKAKFIKRVALEQSNGHAPSGELKDITID